MPSYSPMFRQRYDGNGYRKQKSCNQMITTSFVGSDGFEPPKLEAADLQSAPFGHSGNYPRWWALTDSNRRPSACKADALNQLS